MKWSVSITYDQLRSVKNSDSKSFEVELCFWNSCISSTCHNSFTRSTISFNQSYFKILISNLLLRF